MCPVIHQRFESLSNELLLEVFEYLDGVNLLDAFRGLNGRIDKLLRQAKVQLKIGPAFELDFVDTIKMAFHPSQIRMLLSTDPDPRVNAQLVAYTDHQLTTLCLRDQDLRDFPQVLEQIPRDNRIQCMQIDVKTYHQSNESHNPFKAIFIDRAELFQSLVGLSISPYYSNKFPEVSGVFPNLRRLALTVHQWSPALTQFLRDSTPNLRSLKCVCQWYRAAELAPVALPHIHELHIAQYCNSFNLKTILSNFPDLRRLHVHLLNQAEDMFDGTIWQQLIETYLPKLKQLTIVHNGGFDESIARSFCEGAFWSTKKISFTQTQAKLNHRCPLVKMLKFGPRWHFGYFDRLSSDH